MPKIIVTEQPTKDVCRYLRHWAGEDYASRAIAARHSGIAADRRRRKGRQAALFVAQALEYIDSAATSSLLTKPLPLFYAAENLAKATCIVADPNLTAADFKAHGLKSDQSKRYSIKNLRCSVLPPRNDVWSSLFRYFNADTVRLNMTRDRQAVSTMRRSAYATAQLTGKTLLLGDLIRHLPETTDDVLYADWGHPYVVHVSDMSLTITAASAQTNCKLLLRHGHDQPTKTMIVDRETDLLKDYTRTMDELDVLRYEGSAPNLVAPVMRSDVFGELYMDFRRTSAVLGEPVIYFAILFILSSAVRYTPDEWKRLLDDHPAEAILVDRLFDVMLRKLPNLFLNELHGDVFLFRFAR